MQRQSHSCGGVVCGGPLRTPLDAACDGGSNEPAHDGICRAVPADRRVIWRTALLGATAAAWRGTWCGLRARARWRRHRCAGSTSAMARTTDAT